MEENPEIKKVKVENLLFDPVNPRLPYNSHRKEDEEAVIEWMLRNANITELMGSIGQSGYFPGEPVLVVKSKDVKGSYLVVEGNRRLASVKLLLDPDLAKIKKKSVKKIVEEAKHTPGEIPVIEYNTREEILSYLGYRHITGIQEWNPLQKARYLQQLSETIDEDDPKEKFRVLAKTIGSKSNYVARLLTGLSIYNVIEEDDYFDIEGLDEKEIKFSILTTAISHTNIVKFLGLKNNNDPTLKGLKKDRLKELTSWLFKEYKEGRTRLGESRNLSQLSKIVDSDKALSEFRDGSPLDDAILYTDEPNEVFRNSLHESKSKLQNARNYFHLIQDHKTSDLETLEEILNLAKFLRNGLKGKLEEDKDSE